MATDAYGQSVPYLDYTDKPDLFVLGKGLTDGLTPRSVMRFANATVRASTITSPVAGMITWLADVQRLDIHDGSAWVPVEGPQVQTYNASANLTSSATVYSALNLGGQVSGNYAGMWSSGNPTRLTGPLAGTYSVSGYVLWPAGLGGTSGRAEFRQNGSSTAAPHAHVSTMSGSSGNSASVASGILVFSTPGYAEVYANQSSGGTIALTYAFGMRRISAATS
jgi:hypothetical protein